VEHAERTLGKENIRKEKERRRRGREGRNQLALLILTRPRNGDELIVFAC